MASKLKPAARLVKFIDASPTPYHAVASAVQRLEASGFVRLSERGHWDLKPNGRYFTTRNQSSIIAFTLPKTYRPNSVQSIAVIGCHTDSCNFKLRPVSKKKKPADSNYMAIAVETYGGGLWHTWLDRDLSIAGRVITASKDAQGATSYTPHLVHIRKPLVRIPTVAIHLDRTQNDKFFYNQETGMQAILGTITDQVTGSESTKNKDALDISANHHPKLLELVAQELSAGGSTIKAEDIHDFELSLCDHQPPTLGGVNEEFIFSPRLDNLFSSFCAVDGMTEWVEGKKEIPDGAVNMFALYDNEEIGSLSTFGAESNFLPATMERIVGKQDLMNETIARSYMLSVDQGHALHPAPDHVAKHQAEHRPLMNGGPAIKTNAKMRYASTAASTFILRRIAQKAGVPLQEYEVRNDMACGGTIGSIVSKLGLRTVDIGCVQLSMHSIRETGGAEDVGMLIELFKGFFTDFAEVDKSFTMDE